jgi:hypothetical protein
MVRRVHLVEGGYRVVPLAEAAEQLQLRGGSEVETRVVQSDCKYRYVSVDEARATYLETELKHRAAYLELLE